MTGMACKIGCFRVEDGMEEKAGDSFALEMSGRCSSTPEEEVASPEIQIISLDI
jgi:hypothetical protein